MVLYVAAELNFTIYSSPELQCYASINSFCDKIAKITYFVSFKSVQLKKYTEFLM